MFLMGLDQINLCVGGNRGRGKVRVIVKLCPAILNLMWVLSKLDLIGSDSLITDQFEHSPDHLLWQIWGSNNDKGASIAIIHSSALGMDVGGIDHIVKKFFFSVRFKFSFWIVCIYWSLYFVGDIFNIFELDTSLKPFHSEHKLLFYV